MYTTSTLDKENVLLMLLQASFSLSNDSLQVLKRQRRSGWYFKFGIFYDMKSERPNGMSLMLMQTFVTRMIKNGNSMAN